jgi:hypothetical protein
MRRVFLLLSLLALACFTATAASIAIDQGLFGHLDQADVTSCTSDAGVNNACGPTSFVNSLVYMENVHGDIYGNSLIPHIAGNTEQEDQIAAADIAACYMNCSGNGGGTGIFNFISGKQSYFDAYAPNTTYIENMNVFNNGIWPTFQFMYDMLAQGEDVELLVGFYNVNTPTVRAGGHYVTLTGVSFGVPFANGNGTINFVDPNGGADFNNVALSTSAAPGFAGAIYNNQTYVPGYYTAIEAVVAESPLPEPGTWLLLLASVPVFVFMRRVSVG